MTYYKMYAQSYACMHVTIHTNKCSFKTTNLINNKILTIQYVSWNVLIKSSSLTIRPHLPTDRSRPRIEPQGHSKIFGSLLKRWLPEFSLVSQVSYIHVKIHNNNKTVKKRRQIAFFFYLLKYIYININFFKNAYFFFAFKSFTT